MKNHIIRMARKTAANPDAYYLDLRVRLSVGCKRKELKNIFFFFSSKTIFFRHTIYVTR